MTPDDMTVPEDILEDRILVDPMNYEHVVIVETEEDVIFCWDEDIPEDVVAQMMTNIIVESFDPEA